MIPEPERQDDNSHARWITVFGPSRLEDEDRQEDLGIIEFSVF